MNPTNSTSATGVGSTGPVMYFDSKGPVISHATVTSVSDNYFTYQITDTSTITSSSESNTRTNSKPNTRANTGFLRLSWQYLSALFQPLYKGIVYCLSKMPVIGHFFTPKTQASIPETPALIEQRLKEITEAFLIVPEKDKQKLYLQWMQEMKDPDARFSVFVAVVHAMHITHDEIKPFYDALLPDQQRAFIKKLASICEGSWNKRTEYIENLNRKGLDDNAVKMASDIAYQALYARTQMQADSIPTTDKEKLEKIKEEFWIVPEENDQKLYLHWMQEMKNPADKFSVFVAVVYALQVTHEIVKPFYEALLPEQKAALFNEIQSSGSGRLGDALAEAEAVLTGNLAGNQMRVASTRVYRKLYSNS